MTSPTAPGSDEPIRFTEAAATKIEEIRAAEGLGDTALRLQARPVTGPPAVEYNLYFDDGRKPGDRELEVGGIKIVIDPASLASLAGTEVDFLVTPHGAGFRFKNPNVPGDQDKIPDGPPTYGVLDP